MTKEEFLLALQHAATAFTQALSTPNGDWAVKGFIDVNRNIYTISTDTKVTSKVMELQLFPLIARFATQHRLTMHLTTRQNFYPDITFITAEGDRFALDLKSTYRISPLLVNGMTLGAYSGYFRDRTSLKNIEFPYNSYRAHVVLGFIYSQTDTTVDERDIHALANLDTIPSVLRDIQFFVQEKYRIASDLPGSGNTRNIGSVRSIEQLVNGTGPFATLGVEVFDDYWMNYANMDMSARSGVARGYTNLASYLTMKAAEE